MVQELEATRKAVADRYVKALEATALTLKNLRGRVGEAEDERDRLLRESAPVLRREKAAEITGLSTSRIGQIIGGAS